MSANTAYNYSVPPRSSSMKKRSSDNLRFLTKEDELAHFVTLAKSGDNQAMNGLLKRSAPTVNSMAWSILGRDRDHHDLIQKILLTIVSKLSKLEDPRRYRGWLRVITINEIRSHLRRRKRSRGIFFFGATVEESEGSQDGLDPAQRELTDALYKALDQIAPRLRMAFCLKHIEGYSRKEISQLLECTERTTKRILEQARAKLVELAKEDPVLFEQFVGRGA